MSTNKRFRVMIGLSVLGSFGWAYTRQPAVAGEPRDTNPSPAFAATPSEQCLLLTNGQVLNGIISEEHKNFLVRQPIGIISVAKARVVGVFDSIRKTYDYQVEQLPERDCEERMKLAKWCLSVKLTSEAREQLEKVIQLNSKHSQARAMLFTMDQASTVAQQRSLDPQVRQTAAEADMEDPPHSRESAAIEKAQHGLNITGLPVIFDLPPPLAVKRTHEFIKFVNPLLQAYCVKCHDGNFNGEFQLVPTRTRAEQTQDALRVNLDATLRLVDPENPAKSELLTSTLRPHGEGTRKRAIFQGSNDRAYQVLATWAQSLRSPKNMQAEGRARTERSTPDNDETFAVGRNPGGNENPAYGLSSLTNRGLPPLPGMPSGAAMSPAPRNLSGRPEGMRPEAPDEFPLPFTMTGKKPTVAPMPRSDEPRRADGARPTKTDRNSMPTAGIKPGFTGVPDTARLPSSRPTADLTNRRAADKSGGATGTPKKKISPVEIDPAILERAILNRNAIQ